VYVVIIFGLRTVPVRTVFPLARLCVQIYPLSVNISFVFGSGSAIGNPELRIWIEILPGRAFSFVAIKNVKKPNFIKY
jgi:hypothetical protein